MANSFVSATKYRFVFVAGSLLSIGMSLAARARSLTVDELYLSHTTDQYGQALLIGYDGLPAWCASTGNGIDFGSFEAAKTIEKQADGLYFCRGDFVNVPSRTRMQIFKFSTCDVRDPQALKKLCP